MTPNLRFPEFRDAGEWEAKRLEDVAPLQRGHDLPSYELVVGDVPVFYSNGIRAYHNVGIAKGPGLVTGRSGTIGNLHFIDDGDYWPHNTSLWVTTFKGHHPRFVYFLYAAIGLDRFASGSGVPTLNRNDVHAFKTHVPPSKKEQQRIADCLTSLDACIAAQGRRIQALQAHNRGLMQQLFPSKEETLPSLRFPEFRGDMDWVKRSMADLLDRTSKPVSVDAEVLYREIGVRSHGKGIFHKQPVTGEAIGNKRVFWVVANAFVVNIVFAWEQAVAITSEAEEGMISSHRFPMYLGKPGKCDVRFLKFGFLTPQGKHLLGLASPGGAGRNRTLGQAEFEKIELIVPAKLEEQERIADCLVVIDAQLAAESKKLDALKIHKKGLMQQLFPSSEGVEA